MAEPLPVNDDHLKRLAEAILSNLEGPAPTPPLAPDPVGLSPLHAAAGAMNPQFAPLLLQRANQPGQNAYNQQLMAFEQAMQGRRDAMATGASILNTQTRADAVANRPGAIPRGQIRVVKGPDGGPALQEFIPDGTGGFEPGDILATGPDVVKYLSTPEGFIPVSGRTAPSGSGYVQKPGGGNALPSPPAGIVSDVAAGTATIEGLDTVEGAYKTIRERTVGQSGIGQAARNFIGETRYGGAFKQTRDYAEYVSKRRAGLNAYIKSVTGAQFSVAELERYESMFPEPWDDEALAASKIQALKQRAVSDMQAKMRTFPAAASAGPAAKPKTIDDEFDEFMRSRNAPQ